MNRLEENVKSLLDLYKMEIEIGYNKALALELSDDRLQSIRQVTDRQMKQFRHTLADVVAELGGSAELYGNIINYNWSKR